MPQRIVPSAFCVLLASLLMAQSANPERMARAQDAMKEADRYFMDGGFLFTKALPLYMQVLEVDPDNALLNLKIALCHLNGRHHYKALPYLVKVLEKDPSTPRIHFLLGYALQLNAQWDRAIAEFQAHKKATEGFPDPEPLYNTADKRITECRNGKSFESKPVRAQVENLGPVINGELADYGVLFTPDARTMYFTSRRPTTTGGRLNKATNEYFEDIYTSTFTNSWGDPMPAPVPVNTNGNDATIGLCANGEQLLIYRDDEGVGDIWSSRRNGEGWSAPARLGPNVNTKFHESSAWITGDGRWIYFVSDRPNEGLGGQDIYRAPWDEATNDWGIAENLGPTVNTIHDEDGVFVAADGTLYFGSKGHSTMGGFDLFSTHMEGGQWTKPGNMGWPINSPDDDLYLLMLDDGRTGYFSSVRGGGQGDDDIYRVHFLPAPRPEPELVVNAAESAPVPEEPAGMTIKGKVMDLKMLAGMEASIDLVDLSDPSMVLHLTSNKATGEFSGVVPFGRDYAMHITAEGYLLRAENIHVPLDGSMPELSLVISLKPIEEGIKEVLPNLFFDRDQAQLKSTSLAELASLLDLLRDNPTVRLEVGGHTDSDGTAAHNQQLSEARAQAVVDHLVSNGIQPDRLQAMGYAATQPIEANDSEENKAKNRRTEIKVLAR